MTLSRCQYLHSFSKWVVGPPGTTPNKELTCYFWATAGEHCSLAANECSYAHHDTGKVAPPPPHLRRMDTEISPCGIGQPLGQQCDGQGRARSPAAVYPLPPVQAQGVARSRDSDRPLERADLQELARRLKQESSQGPSLHQVPAFQLDYGQVCILGTRYASSTALEGKGVRWRCKYLC